MTTIQFMGTKRKRSHRPDPLQFTYRDDKPLKWPQKALLWGLRQLGCHALIEDVETTFHEIPVGKLPQSVLDQISGIHAAYGVEPREVLVGPDEFGVLRQNLHVSVCFDVEYMKHGARGTTIYGVKITMIPWMKGVIALPPQSTDVTPIETRTRPAGRHNAPNLHKTQINTQRSK